ncbi:unnamed protein product [Phytophthora fragariaefolia]|uniref:Unnamed protein product n=1 Tax=Phytophthora fragariaefolia TaxID=1490495 RepID=A0A9W6Y0Z4_9STRA|nr:unnamed protein product [Phytophthora fragariaefolia]
MDLRQTTDYREVNSKTEVMAAVMPILSMVMENARGKQHFGLFDLMKGFSQLPLAEFCQEWLSYMTDEKIFTPRWVPQGCADAAIHFQKTMEKCFTTLLYKHLPVWIDDLLLCAEDIDTYLDKLAESFELLNEFGLKLSVKKSSLYQKEVKWCGKIIDANGVCHDPARIDSLREIPYPSTAGELRQFICAINWMRESLIDYARHVAPLHNKLGEALAKTRRTKRAAAGILIELDAVEKAAFDNVKHILASAVTLSFPDNTATTCLLADVSDMGCDRDSEAREGQVAVLVHEADELQLHHRAYRRTPQRVGRHGQSVGRQPHPGRHHDQASSCRRRPSGASGDHSATEHPPLRPFDEDILQVIRTMVLEYKIHHKDWVYLVPMVQSSRNHTAVPSLGHRAPVELFTGLQCPTPLREFYLPNDQDLREVPTSADIDALLAKLRSSIQDMHKVISGYDPESTKRVAIRCLRVVRADAHSFRVQHLITGTELDVHASRLKFYADPSLNVTEEPLEHISSQGIVLAVEKLKDHR